MQTGAMLKFSLAGEGVSINPETGELCVPVESLGAGLALTVTLRLAAEATPAPDVAPEAVAAPILTGSGQIGTAVSVDPGQWSGEPAPEIELQWCLDGEAIAEASAAEYWPEPADDGRSLSCRVTASNAAGSAEAEAGGVTIRFAAPTLVDLLADVVATQGDDAVLVEAAAAFAGDGLTFAVSGAEAEIDAETGRVKIPTATLRTAETVTVTASNSGGSAATDFQVTIEPAAAELPVRILAALWSAEEVRDAAPTGRRRISISPKVSVPAGFELRFYSGREAGSLAPRLNSTRAMQPGEVFTTAGSLAIGTICHNLLFWHHLEDGTWSQASENEVVFEILGLKPAEEPPVEKPPVEQPPAEPVPVLPAVLSVPVLAGTGKIGSELTVDPGTWSGEPTLSLQWLRNGAAIAAADKAAYMPVAEDDLAEICCRVTARNAAGEAVAETASLKVTHVAPVAVGELADEVFDEDTGPQEVPTAQAFEGESLVFSVIGEGAVIDPATGIVTLDTATPRVETIKVTATNSGGSAMQAFVCTVEALPEVLPQAIAATLWTFEAEAWSAERNGARMSVTPASAVKVPEGYELRCYIGTNPAGVGATNVTARLVPGTKFTTNGFFSGDIHARLYWRALETDGYEIADEGGKLVKVVTPTVDQPIANPGKLPSPTPEMLAQAASMPDPRYLPIASHASGAGTSNNAFNGLHPLTLALGELSGALSAGQRNALISRLKFIVAGGNEPACEGGFPAQHEMNAFAMAAVCRHLPIWDSLTATEQARWDVVMKGGLLAHGFIMSNGYPSRLNFSSGGQVRNIRGGDNVYPSGNPNHRCGYIGAMLACAMYFGTSRAQSLMTGFELDAFVAEANAAGMAHIRDTFARNWGSNSPTKAELESAIRNWSYRHGGAGLSQILAIIGGEVEYCFDRPVVRGLNDGVGINGCGTTIANINPPNLGVLGMARELNAVDGAGGRSEIRYSIWGARSVMQMVLLAAARGLWDPAAAGAQTVMARMNIGMNDLIWKQRVAGYRDYSSGSCRKTWEPDSAADRAEWGLTYTWGLWEAVLQPFHALGGAIAPPPPPLADDTFTAASVDDIYSSIRFDFSAQRTGGRYVLGDPYVLNGTTITRTLPASTTSSGRIINGAQRDVGRWPGPGFRTDRTEAWNRVWGPEWQGFDSGVAEGNTSNTIGYRDELNIAPERTGAITIPSGQEATLTKTQSRGDTDNRQLVTDFCHLTVVNSIPPAGAFRPSPMAASKAAPKTVADMEPRMALLPNLPIPASMASDARYPNIDAAIRWLERPHNHSHQHNGTKQNVYPSSNQQNAGRLYAQLSACAALSLCMNWPIEKKRRLARAVCQQGLDIYEAAKQGRTWEDNGQLMHGRKILLVLAGWFFDDADMKRYGGRDTSLYRGKASTGNTNIWGDNNPIFTEDRQIHIVPQSWVSSYSVPQRMVGHPMWLDKFTWNSNNEPSQPQNNMPGARYQVQYVTHCFGQALAIRLIPGAREIWNYQPFFDYCDYMAAREFGRTQAWQNGTSGLHRENVPAVWHRDMWSTHRSGLGGVYPHSY